MSYEADNKIYGDWELTPLWMMAFGHRAFRRKVGSRHGMRHWHWEYSE